LTKVIDVSDEAEPLPPGYNFSSLEPELLDPDAAVFDSGFISPSHIAEELVGMAPIGMAPKPRDPADVMLIQNFIARHGLRLSGFFPQVRAGRFLCDGLPRPHSAPRPPGAEKGLTRVPPRVTVMEAGKRWVTPSEEARLRYYKRGVGEVSSSVDIVPVHRAQDDALKLAGVYEDRLSVQSSGMSLSDGRYSRPSWVRDSQKLPKEGPLPDRHCLNPECLKEIGAKRHHNKQYCDAKCSARAKELRRRDKRKQAGRPVMYRNESDVSSLTGSYLWSNQPMSSLPTLVEG
jgi:hypothetical protein